MQSVIEEVHAPVVICLCFEALSEWHLGEIASCKAASRDAISLAKELNDMPALAHALYLSAMLGQYDDNRAEVEPLASDLIELSTRQDFAFFLPIGEMLRGWVLSVSGSTAEGIAWIDDGMRRYQGTGSMVLMPYWLAVKAKALHLAERTSEALEAIKEAESLVERSGERWWYAELQRLRGVLLTTVGADDTLIEAAFCEAIRTAREQKSTSLVNRAEATYAAYRCQKAARKTHLPVKLEPKKISVARLPISGSDLFGREEDIAFLANAWANQRVNIVTIVAWAGVGKSTLVNHWLRRMAAEDYHSAELVFGWSFYRQGTDRGTSSADEFLDAALAWFGDPDPRIGTAWEKGERLAKLIAHRRTLLVLDGLEPLQNPPGPQEGRVREPSLQALLRELAAFNTGLCVITTRLPVADIADHEGTSVLRRELEQLSSDAGAKLLRALGVKGRDAELRSASEEFTGHCLALTLLGSYLTDAYDGDIRCRKEVSERLAHDVRQGVHARKVMESYQTWFGEGPELSVLRMLGFFDRPADEQALKALLKPPAIPGLTESLTHLSACEWRAMLTRLRRARLVAGEDPHNPGQMDTHPLVREYFGEQLRSRYTGAWQEGNRRLYHHCRALAPELPDSVRDMEPLFLAAICACNAGRFREALHEIYIPRIQRGNASFAANALGARGAVLTVLIHFFEDGRWGFPAESRVEGQGLTPEDQLFILIQAGLYLIHTRGMSAPEARICFERAESLCHSLNRPLTLYVALGGQFCYSLMTDRLTATTRIAKRVYSLAQQQNVPALMVGAYRALTVTSYYSGDFAGSRQYAMSGLQIWRSGGVQSPVEELIAPAVECLCYQALSEWHLETGASGQATMAEAIALAKELNNMPALGLALYWAGLLAHFEGNPAEVERLALDLIELSTRQNFASWLPGGVVLRGWARSASGDPAEGIARIEEGIRDYQATGAVLRLPYFLALKAEALHRANRSSEALDATKAAEALAEKSEGRWWCAELYRLRGVFLISVGADQKQIEDSFREAIRTARQQRSASLAKRAEATYAEYRHQRAAAADKLPAKLGPKKISVARLPVSGTDLFGREEDIAFLDDAWANQRVNIVTIVAWAGVGKSTLVNHWLRRLATEAYRSAELVFGWSFYRQGTSASAASSADEFLDAALAWFGDPDPRIGTVWEKGERLASLISDRRTLLVLDGLEPLQYPPGSQEGRVREASLQALLRELAAFNTGLCVITTRLPVADIADHEGTSVLRRELEHLSSMAGAKVLRAQNVTGDEEELRAASDEFGGHSLALTLLGSYLTDAYRGDIRCRGEVTNRLARDVRQGSHARKVMESYQAWFGDGPELSVLRMLGLFDRPVDEKVFEVLVKPPAIRGLTESLTNLSPTQRKTIVGKLRRARLVSGEDLHNPGQLDTHPLVREYFGEQLRTQQPDAWKESNRRLYRYYRTLAPELPANLREMEPLLLAAVCGCNAGLFHEALREIYIPRIQRGNMSFAANVLGARGAVLSVLAHFFQDGCWGSLAEMGADGQSFTPDDQLFVLIQAAILLTATRGLASLDARICCERAESLCRSLDRPALLYSTLKGQYHYSLMTDRLTATLQIAKRIQSLAQEQNDSALMVGAYSSLASTRYFLGDFDAARQSAVIGLQLWRSGGAQNQIEEVLAPAVICLCYRGLCEWHFGETGFSQATLAEAISLAKELNDLQALVCALYWAAFLAHYNDDPAEVERLASGLVELSTRQSFATWQPHARILRGWCRAVFGSMTEGMSSIEDGIAEYRAAGAILALPFFQTLKAEALRLAGRTTEALAALGEGETVVERSEARVWCAELYRLRGVFLAANGAHETQIEASFQAAISTAKAQKSASLAARAEASYAEYLRGKGELQGATHAFGQFPY
jgi:predicted ATPase/GTPase SAR1 family protein